MGMYPAYTRQAVADEYAVSFFTLLNDGYRRLHKHYQMLANITLLPNMDKTVRESFLRELKWATMSPSDILKTDSDDAETGIDDVKKLFGKT